MKMVVIETPRLLLRPLQPSDFEHYARMGADPETMKFIGGGKTVNTVDAWRAFAALFGHWVLRGYGAWALEEKSTGRFVGRAGLYYPEGWPALEVGWTIDRQRWGEGFATEAGQRAMRWAFETLDLEVIHSVIDPANVASIRVATKLGETLRNHTVINGTTVALYGITRTEFEQLHGPLELSQR